MTDLWTYLQTAKKPILLYGMGNGADKIFNRLNTLGISVSGVFVSDGFVRDKTYRGFKLMNYSDAKNIFGDFIVLTAFGTQLTEVMDNIKRISNEQQLFSPDLPVFGENIFDKEFYSANKESIDFVKSRFADKKSAEVFDDIITYKLSGNIIPLCRCETEVSEAYENILRLTDTEIYLDLGAYRGDTVQQFLNYAGGAKKIYAVEPDCKSFKKLVQNVGSDVVCLNVAIWEKTGFVTFDTQSRRNSHVSNLGIKVQTDTVDNILNGSPATFIKMDVEGAEKQAIMGARFTIQNYKPKLSIAAYHRSEDIFEIPKQILALNPDYKMYLRHFPYIPAWDLNYYFI